MTECSETLFRLKLVFRGKLWRSSREAGSPPNVVLCCCAKLIASWDCCGAWLAASPITGSRSASSTALEEMLAQRVYGLALGYEDRNDHQRLRQDPLLGLLAGKRDLGEPLAGKSTLNRLKLTPAGSPAVERYNTRLPILPQPSTNCWSRSFWSPIGKRRDPSLWIWMPRTRTTTITASLA
jgi:hypothetical protein